MKRESTHLTFALIVTNVLLALLVIIKFVRFYDDECHDSPVRLLGKYAPKTDPKSSAAWQINCPVVVHGPFNHGFKEGNYQTRIASTAFIESFEEVRNGGWWSPKDCKPVHQRIAVIIPIRGRKQHLRTYLALMHPYLQQQRIPYVIITVEQPLEHEWNKGLLVNMGVLHAPRWINCFILADVDMVPDRMENMFTCDEAVPKSLLSGASYYYDYAPIHPHNFGGIVALTRHQFFMINGFSTLFWGWGDEDNDMYFRAVHFYGGISRVAYNVGLVTHLDHGRNESGTIDRRRLDKIPWSKYDYNLDGLRNTTSQCSVKKIEQFPLRTAIVIECTRRPDKEIEELTGVSLH